MLKRKEFITLFMVLALIFGGLGRSFASESNGPSWFFIELKKELFKNKLLHVGDEKVGSISESVDKFLKVTQSVERLQKFSDKLGVALLDEIQSRGNLNGQQLYLVSKVLGAYHYVAIELQEYASAYNLSDEIDQTSFLSNADDENNKKHLIWLAAQLTTYDNIFKGYDTYFHNGPLRRVLKDVFKADSRANHKLKELSQLISNQVKKKNRKTYRQFVARFINLHEQLLRSDDAQIVALTKFILDNDATTEFVNGIGPKMSSHGFVDGLVSFVDKFVNVISGWFGNFAGAIRWRHGHLFGDKNVEAMIQKELRPLDILLERTPFALTDLFIPGNFGHAALYIGTEEQLKEIGMWEHPMIKKYHNAIRAGHTIVEAIRPGVGMKSLEEFIEIDEIAVLRVTDVFKDKMEVEQIYTRALNQIGKKYDFNFNVNTTETIVCSELIYHSFGKIQFPVEYTLGRPTISPDNVAELSLWGNRPIELEFYLFSAERGKLEHWNQLNLAGLLGYRKSEQLSTTDRLEFEKEYTQCRRVKRKLRQGSYRHEFRTINVCKKAWKHIKYEAPKDFPVDYSF